MSDKIRRAPHDQENPFAQISREMLQDKHLSYEARGLLGYLLSKSGNWELRVSDLQIPGAGRDKVYRILNELQKCGYIGGRTKYQDEKGYWQWTPYDVYETRDLNPFTENPYTDKPNTGDPHTENTEIYKTKKTKERKEKILPLPAAIASGGGDDLPHSHTPSLADEADDASMFKKIPVKQMSSQAKKVMRAAQTPSFSLEGTMGEKSKETTTPQPPIAAELAAVADQGPSISAAIEGKPPVTAKVESPAQAAQRIKVESLVACGFVEPTTTRGWSNFKGVLKTLTEAKITSDMYADYVKWVKAESASQSNWTVTLNSLGEKMRPERYMEYRAKNASQGGQMRLPGASGISYHQPSELPVKSRPVLSQEERIAALEEIKREQIS